MCRVSTCCVSMSVGEGKPTPSPTNPYIMTTVITTNTTTNTTTTNTTTTNNTATRTWRSS